ncbi:MAG: DNA-3-methyladenine glycosylase [Candidatus Limnocylindrales bacterium]
MSPQVLASAAPPVRVPAVGEPLPPAFYVRATPELALALLGVRVVRRWASGGLSTATIVEVEAYGGPEDQASHARFGPTRRNLTMFGPAGHAYVYRIYGIHHCLNIVGAADGAVGAVLVRAAMPDAGVNELAARRSDARADPPSVERLAAGPGNLCAALGIGLELDGLDLRAGEGLWLAAPAEAARQRLLAAGVVRGPRVGVERRGAPWAALAWRFGVRGHPALSRPFARGA